MKKTRKVLQLNLESIRTLNTEVLDQIAGGAGAPTFPTTGTFTRKRSCLQACI